MIKHTEGLSSEFKKIHMQEIKLYIKYLEDKVKDNMPISDAEIEEAVNALRDKLEKIRDLGGKELNN